ncbi:MAG: phage virion morphogenesis protein [Candidatus Auribacterota bacterium]|jgi:phage gpG-like protein|nr:phage virion morphogenesis protein [Candidatus Auribacterota bacterium]
MARDLKFLAEDVKKHSADVGKAISEMPRVIAGAAIKMKDANFSAQGFVENGRAVSPWPKRKSETTRSDGKRILHSTGNMQDSVRKRISGNRISIGIDLGKVPYAHAHNEGFKGSVNIKSFSRQTRKGTTTVKAHTRKVDIPERKFLGYTVDIDKIVEKELAFRLNKIFNK